EFRLTRRALVTIAIATRTGRVVTTFVRDHVLGPGPVRLIWRGRVRGRVLADGSYFPQVDFVSLHRLFRLPSPITIDDRRPRILRVAVHRSKHALGIEYTFDTPAHIALFSGG